METILQALIIYFIVLIILRLAGKRTLGQITPFDFVLLLIIAEASQQALLGDDYSLTNATIVISVLVGLDILMSHLKRGIPKLSLWADGAPVVVFSDGELIKSRAGKERVDESDILEAARHAHGIENLQQIKYAVLEKSGGIAVILK